MRDYWSCERLEYVTLPPSWGLPISWWFSDISCAKRSKLHIYHGSRTTQTSSGNSSQVQQNSESPSTWSLQNARTYWVFEADRQYISWIYIYIYDWHRLAQHMQLQGTACGTLKIALQPEIHWPKAADPDRSRESWEWGNPNGPRGPHQDSNCQCWHEDYVTVIFSWYYLDDKTTLQNNQKIKIHHKNYKKWRCFFVKWKLMAICCLDFTPPVRLDEDCPCSLMRCWSIVTLLVGTTVAALPELPRSNSTLNLKLRKRSVKRVAFSRRKRVVGLLALLHVPEDWDESPWKKTSPWFFHKLKASPSWKWGSVFFKFHVKVDLGIPGLSGLFP